MSGSRLRSTASVRASALALAVSVLAVPAAAQQKTVLEGLVAEDDTGRLIESASVTLVETGTETRTDAEGIFRFSEAPVGRFLVRVRARGYPTVVEEVEVTAEQDLFVPIFLPSAAVVLDELLVTARRGGDRLHTPQAQTAADLLALHLPDLRPGATYVRRRVTPQRLGLRGRGTFGGDGEPTIVLDGAVLSEGIEALRQIPAAQVRSIRIQKGPSAAFLYGSAEGVIYIQTEAGPPPG